MEVEESFGYMTFSIVDHFFPRKKRLIFSRQINVFSHLERGPCLLFFVAAL